MTSMVGVLLRQGGEYAAVRAALVVLLLLLLPFSAGCCDRVDCIFITVSCVQQLLPDRDA